ncbi:Uncharacterised protein [Bordetella pertussis]|nr:Uncharacterised protein [Bordetella pertussis]CFW45706.1 Uncharacterised protein [Bordetella pertussis]
MRAQAGTPGAKAVRCQGNYGWFGGDVYLFSAIVTKYKDHCARMRGMLNEERASACIRTI